jgi:peptide deformylase
MAILEILQYPDPRLRIKAQPIKTIDDALLRIVDDMYETMYAKNGIGLAGTQVNIHQQIFVMDGTDDGSGKRCVLNPEILHREGKIDDAEGCLSVGGGAHACVGRASKVRLRGMDLQGNIFEMDAEGLMAHIFQHESDHLQGILFIDYLSRLKQERIRKRIEKSKR